MVVKSYLKLDSTSFDPLNKDAKALVRLVYEVVNMSFHYCSMVMVDQHYILDNMGNRLVDKLVLHFYAMFVGHSGLVQDSLVDGMDKLVLVLLGILVILKLVMMVVMMVVNLLVKFVVIQRLFFR